MMRQIAVDIPRTRPGQKLFQIGALQLALQRILSASGTCATKPAFRDAAITTETGSQVDWIRQPTSVAIGPARRLYVGTLNGSIAVLGYDPSTLTANTYCYSDSLTDPEFKTDTGALSPGRYSASRSIPRTATPCARTSPCRRSTSGAPNASHGRTLRHGATAQSS